MIPSASQSPELPNLARVIEDFTATRGVLEGQLRRNRPIEPPPGILSLFGAACLGLKGDEAYSQWLRASPWPLEPFASSHSISTLSGQVRLSQLLAGAILAYFGQSPSRSAHRFDWDAGLRWLVLYGIQQHALWLFLSENFVADLTRKAVRVRGGQVSPLQLIVARERPFYARQFGTPGALEFDEHFERWLIETGVDEFGLFWLLSAKRLSHRPAPSQFEWRKYLAGQSGEQTYDVLPPMPGSLRALRNRLIWPDERRTPSSSQLAGRRQQTPQCTYRSFGEDFRCARIEFGPGGMGRLPLTTPAVELDLPREGYPTSVLLLYLDILPALEEVLWIEVSVGGNVQDLRPAAFYKRGPVKLLIPESSPRPSHRLGLHFAQDPRASGPQIRPGTVVGLLRTVEIWRLPASSA